MFCSHIVFMCFVYISKQTAIISLYRINWLKFTTEKECVYCTVRTMLWRQVNVNAKKAVAWLRLLVADFWMHRPKLDSNPDYLGFIV